MAKRIWSSPHKFEEVSQGYKEPNIFQSAALTRQHRMSPEYLLTRLFSELRITVFKKRLLSKCNSKIKNQNDRTRHVVQVSYIVKMN